MRRLLCLFLLTTSGCGRDPSPEDATDAGADAAASDAAGEDSGAACGDGLEACGESCVDLLTDDLHCGACEDACEAGTLCLGGACGIPAGMSAARVAPGATVDATGLLVAAGGIGGGEVQATVESYDTATNRWTSLPAMPQGRAVFGLARGAGDRLYCFGGIDPTGALIRSIDVYDPATASWTTEGETPGAMVQHAVVATTEGIIYLIGGSTGAQTSSFVDVFDSAEGDWSTGVDLPTARFGLAAAQGPDGRIVVVGGGIPDGDTVAAFDVVEAYDPASDEWETLAPMREPRFEPAAAFGPDGRLYVTGGHGPDHATLATGEVYDPATDEWTALPIMSWPRAGHVALIGSEGRLYMIGGHGVADTEALDTIDVFDFESETWTDSPFEDT